MTSISGVGGGFRPPPPGKPPSFETLDQNSDGALSLDEFKAGAPKDADTSKSEKLFKDIDADGDGSISKDESDAFKSKVQAADQQLQAFLLDLHNASQKAGETSDEDDNDDLFGTLDANSDGNVTKDEFLDAIAQGQKTSSDLLSKLFDAIDTDKSGSVSKDETKAFQAAIERRPPPPPPADVQNATQAYGTAYRLGATASTAATLSQAA